MNPPISVLRRKDPNGTTDCRAGPNNIIAHQPVLEFTIGTANEDPPDQLKGPRPWAPSQH